MVTGSASPPPASEEGAAVAARRGGGQAPGLLTGWLSTWFVSWIFFFLTKDLPGYYFDPEKNRYFRLLPGHNNCNPLTKESIRQKEMESKRLQLLEEEDRQGKVGATPPGAARPLHSCQRPPMATRRCQLNTPVTLSLAHFGEGGVLKFPKGTW